MQCHNQCWLESRIIEINLYLLELGSEIEVCKHALYNEWGFGSGRYYILDLIWCIPRGF